MTWPWSRKQDALGSVADKQRGYGEDVRTKLIGHQNRVIKGKIKNFDQADHRSKMAKWHPLAYAVTYALGDVLTANPWQYVSTSDKKEPVELPVVESAWREWNLRAYFAQAITKDLIHGRAFICRFKNNKFRVYSDEHLVSIKHDELGEPQEIEVAVEIPAEYSDYRTKNVKIQAQDFVCVTTNVEAGYTYGFGILQAIWDDLLDIAELDDNLIPYLKQQGSGITSVHVPPNAKPTQVQNIKDNFLDAKFSGKALIIKAPKDKGFGVFNDSKPSVAPDFMSAFEWKLQKICTATRFPKRWFVGSEQGALSAASEDGLWVIQRLHEIFQKYVKFIKEINRKWIDPRDTGDYDIVPTIEFRQTEKERWEAELAKAQAITAKIVLDINEMRKELGYETLPEFENKFIQVEVMKAANPEMPEMQFELSESQQQQEATQQQDSLRLWEQIQNGLSMNELAEASGISKPTLYKIKQYLDSLCQPVRHNDSFHIDSFTDDGEYLIATGSIFAPVPLPYPHLNETHLNSAEEIKRFVETHRGKTFDLGYEHEDGPLSRKIGHVEVVDFRDGKDISRFYIRKDAFQQYNIPLDRVHVSADYFSQDIPSARPGIDKEHKNIRLNNVVITQQGRCGDECSIKLA